MTLQDELLATVDATRERWRAAIDAAGDRVEEPGAAGEWTLRDVVAHINAYHRFLVLELGGAARPFGELREHDGNDFQQRNEALHEDDAHLGWTDVRDEHDAVFDLLRAEVERRSDEELTQPMVEWAPLTVAQWVTNLTADHWTEHEADLQAFLRAPGTPA